MIQRDHQLVAQCVVINIHFAQWVIHVVRVGMAINAVMMICKYVVKVTVILVSNLAHNIKGSAYCWPLFFYSISQNRATASK